MNPKNPIVFLSFLVMALTMTNHPTAALFVVTALGGLVAIALSEPVKKQEVKTEKLIEVTKENVQHIRLNKFAVFAPLESFKNMNTPQAITTIETESLEMANGLCELRGEKNENMKHVIVRSYINFGDGEKIKTEFIANSDFGSEVLSVLALLVHVGKGEKWMAPKSALQGVK